MRRWSTSRWRSGWNPGSTDSTDARLRAALRPVTRDATVVIVAQRVSTIIDADLILVLEDGRIVGQGTHDQLVDTCETYREIVESQRSAEVAA